MSTRIIKVSGLAGSGKTHHIANRLVESVLKHGMKYDNMLSISFTKAAGQSLRERCADLYSQSEFAIRHKSFEHANIRTLHSFAHEYFLKKYFGEQENSVGGRAMYYNISEYEPARRENIERALSKLRLFSYDDDKFNETMEEIKFKWKVLNIDTVYKDYLTTKAKRFDYADALVFALNSLALRDRWRFVSIDEAQDLSPIHWEIVRKHIIPNSDEVLIAGDPTQSIHIWAGADPYYFLDKFAIPADEEVELKLSHRIPDKVLPVINALQRRMTDGTSEYQIETEKKGGSVKHMSWQECVLFLKEQSDERKDTLVLSLSGFKLGKIGNSLIEAGVLFMQDKRSEFTPWSPTVTKSDWYAYSLYHFIWNKMYDTKIEYGKVWRMVESSRRLTDTWAVFSDPSERDRGTFSITVEELMRALGIEKDLNEYDLLQTLFEWPPRKRRILWTGAERMKDKKDDPQTWTRAHHRILNYIQSCGEGPYVEPVIKLSTVHGAKGLEAETVVLLLTRDELRTDDDKRKLCINAICRSKSDVIFTWLSTDKRHSEHALTDKNLSEVMTDQEFLDYLDARWKQ